MYSTERVATDKENFYKAVDQIYVNNIIDKYLVDCDDAEMFTRLLHRIRSEMDSKLSNSIEVI